MLRWIFQNWSLKLLALVIAVVMWYFVAAQEKAEVTLKVAVELTNVPRHAMVVGEVVSELEVRLSGPRALIRRVPEMRAPKTISLSDLPMGEHVFQVAPEDLRFPPGLRVLRISPSSVTVHLVRRVTKKVPVRPVLKGDPAPGHEVKEVVFKPKEVEISGSEEDLKEVDWLWTMPLDVGGLKETTTVKATLRLPRGRTLRLEFSSVEAKLVVTQPPQTKPPSSAPAPAADGGA